MQFEKALFNGQTQINLTGSHFNLLIIPWKIIDIYLSKGPEMGAIYLSLIKSYKELGWWNDADDCNFQYNIYKNKSNLIKKLMMILTSSNQNCKKIMKKFQTINFVKSVQVLKEYQPRSTDLASFLCGYGIRIEYLILTALLTIIIFGLSFYFINYNSESIIESLKNSSLLFLSGNLENLAPPYSYIAACESLLRSLVLSIFIVILTRKMFR
jgi:hypothetical protein